VGFRLVRHFFMPGMLRRPSRPWRAYKLRQVRWNGLVVRNPAKENASWWERQLHRILAGSFSALEEGGSRFDGIVVQSSFRNVVAAPHCCLTNSYRICYLFRNTASKRKLVKCSNTILLQRKSIRKRFKLSPKAVHGSMKQIRRTAR